MAQLDGPVTSPGRLFAAQKGPADSPFHLSLSKGSPVSLLSSSPTANLAPCLRGLWRGAVLAPTPVVLIVCGWHTGLDGVHSACGPHTAQAVARRGREGLEGP